MELLILCMDLLSMGGLDFWRISVQLFAKGKQTVGFFFGEEKQNTSDLSRGNGNVRRVITFHCFSSLYYVQIAHGMSQKGEEGRGGGCIYFRAVRTGASRVLKQNAWIFAKKIRSKNTILVLFLTAGSARILYAKCRFWNTDDLAVFSYGREGNLSFIWLLLRREREKVPQVQS